MINAFDAAMSGADDSALGEMGEIVMVNGSPVRAIRQPTEAQSELGAGGFGMVRSARFEFSASDVSQFSIKAGVKITAGGEEWRVGGMRVRGATAEVVCLSTSGQTKEF